MAGSLRLSDNQFHIAGSATEKACPSVHLFRCTHACRTHKSIWLLSAGKGIVFLICCSFAWRPVVTRWLLRQLTVVSLACWPTPAALLLRLLTCLSN